MVLPSTFGTWKQEDTEYRKETEEMQIILEPVSETCVYCFVELESSVYEFEHTNTSYIDDLCAEVMKKESHNGDIIDVLESLGFTQIHT